MVTAEWHQLLACPICGDALVERSAALACGRGHSFDIARQGYVNLLPGDACVGTADTPAMVAARSAFLAIGHFAALDDALGDLVADVTEGVAGCVVDMGAGTGEHLAAVLDRIPGRTGIALDISKHAARRAARAHERIGVVVCDAWSRLPLRDGVAAAVLSVFAPRNAAEFRRVLSPGGSVVVVTPTPDHLRELVGPLGMVRVDPHKDERLEAALGGLFRRVRTEVVERTIHLGRGDAVSAALMGPSAHHASPAEIERRALYLPDPVDVTLSLVLSVWEPADDGAPHGTDRSSDAADLL